MCFEERVVVFLWSLLCIALCVTIHIRGIFLLLRWFPRSLIRSEWVVAAVIILHMIEAYLFALAHFVIVEWLNIGTIEGDFSGHFMDYAYYSLVCYTSLGFGDLTPQGGVQLLSGLEALTGLVLIAWSATFLFIQLFEERRNTQNR